MENPSWNEGDELKPLNANGALNMWLPFGLGVGLEIAHAISGEVIGEVARGVWCDPPIAGRIRARWKGWFASGALSALDLVCED